MTITPLPAPAGEPTAFRLVCDDCGRYRSIRGMDGLCRAITHGWTRILHESRVLGHWIAGHRCRRCTRAVEAAIPAPTAVIDMTARRRGKVVRIGGCDLGPAA